MSTAKKPASRRTAKAATKKTTTKAKSKEARPQGHVCSEAGCGRSFGSGRGLASHRRQAHPPAPERETPTAAVERALKSVEVTPKLAVLAATVRELARALEQCDPTDKAKTAKELTARMNDLLSGSSGEADAGDEWGDLE